MVEIPEHAVKAAWSAYVSFIGNAADGIADAKEAVLHALTAAAPHMSGMKVKQLEWGIGGNLYSAGRYNIEDLGDNWSDDRYQLYEAGTRIATFPSLVKAKAAAQADYEKRILSALEPTAAREKALPSELIREYVEDYEWRTDSGDYTPNNTERAMIEDAIAGYAGYIDEVFAYSAREQALDLSVLERLAKIADEYDEPDENGPFPDIQDAMISIRDLRQIRKLLAAIRALKSQPAPQTGGGNE